ncbi:MAG: adenosylmethionine decarboxylase [Candidatus Krumholzibacteria bacterium]|jgi:S-adenosylmethionine decarboxylase|nr:adenosylmethionine decarboxylase [Candidatus Krumholzibacteria bacterium]
MLFEGTEKKFEILVGPDGPDLRALGRDFWERIIAASRAEILSHTQSRELDAYLLSESSLFVNQRWAVMITCGQTTLIDGLLTFLAEVDQRHLLSLIYERKNENFPAEQRSSFAQDVARLRERIDGADLIFGDPQGDRISLFHLHRPHQPDADDATLELLMHDIDDEAAALFAAGGPSRAELRQRLGLNALLPGFAFDDHVFTPQGYSLNAVRDASYATMHVTPERDSSYASFEMGWGFDAAQARRTVTGLLAVLQPRRADMLVFARDIDAGALPADYRADRRCSVQLPCGYPVEYVHLIKEL